MNKAVVYTVLLGGYGRLYEPVKYSDEIDYICFTDDQDIKSDIWKVLPHPCIDVRNKRIESRLLKMCPHRKSILWKYNVSMYTDANTILKEVPDIEEILGDSKIAVKTHNGRNNIFDEAFACRRAKLDKVELIDYQMQSYAAQGIDLSNSGLFACGTIFRRHNDPEIVFLGEEWWRHVNLYSCRDQLSFPVVYKDHPVKQYPRAEYDKLITLVTKHYIKAKEERNVGI